MGLVFLSCRFWRLASLPVLNLLEKLVAPLRGGGVLVDLLLFRCGGASVSVAVFDGPVSGCFLVGRVILSVDGVGLFASL